MGKICYMPKLTFGKFWTFVKQQTHSATYLTYEVLINIPVQYYICTGTVLYVEIKQN